MRKRLITVLLASVLLSSCGGSSGPKFTLTFDPNGGQVSITTLKVGKGKTDKLPTPTKEGKEFIGWYTGWGKTDRLINASSIIDKDLSLIAMWDSYDLKYLDGNGETHLVVENAPNKHAVEPGFEAVHGPIETPYFLKWDFDYTTPINHDYEILPLWTNKEIHYVHVQNMALTNGKTYQYSFVYDDDYFLNSAVTFNKDLMLYCYGLALSSCLPSMITSYYNESGFSNIYIPDYYRQETDANNVAYSFAHKTINDKDIIMVIPRGANYDREWGNNFLVGSTGNHLGFKNSSDIIYNSLIEYASTNSYDLASSKLVLTGYSRGGAIANILANRLLKEHVTSEQNMFVYTFEAPQGLSSENIVECSNVFNIINEADVIPMLPPSEYDFTRCGTDIHILDADVDNLLKAYDEDLALPKFKASSGKYTTENELPQYIINRMLNYTDVDAKHLSISTREDYVSNLQDSITYLLDLFFSINNTTLNKIVDDVKEKGISLITYLTTENGLYDYLVPFFDEGGVIYDDTKLKTSLETLRLEVAGGAFSFLISFVSDFNPIVRMISMHAPEVNYVLIKNIK